MVWYGMVPVHILTEGFHLAELGGVVVVEWIRGHAIVELLYVVGSLGAQVVNLVVVLGGG